MTRPRRATGPRGWATTEPSLLPGLTNAGRSASTQTAATRIAVCGGPYANPYALGAFVADARQRGAKALYCLGDLGGFGAEVDELWPLLEDAEVVCLAGNYDVAIARGDPDCGCGYRDPTDNAYSQLIYDYTRSHTSPHFARWMGHLPTERREQIAGWEVLFVHGSPLGLNDFWWESLPPAEHELRVAAGVADVICCTHSGLAWQRRIGDTLVVNVGVLGKPANDGRREVWYALVDLTPSGPIAELVPLAYDWEAQARSMRRAGIPELFVETIETGWWTTCIESLPPAERARGRFHLYRSALPQSFRPVDGSWGAGRRPEAEVPATPSGPPDPGPPDPGDDLPVVPLFASPYFPPRLWIYTNFHCNLACDYCAVGSSPRAPAQLLSAARIGEVIEQARSEGFEELYLTGGEPLLHPELGEILRMATTALPTVLLTNATLVRATRLERLRPFAGHPRLVVQTSLDGPGPAIHDVHRGRGSFERTVAGITTLVQLGLTVRVAMTATQENEGTIEEVATLLARLGVERENFVVRPLLQRGLSASGLRIDELGTVPELTVAANGLYWHPAGADARPGSDLRIADGATDLRDAKRIVVERFLAARLTDGTLPRPYRCAV